MPKFTALARRRSSGPTASGGILALASNPQFDPNLFDPTNRNSEALQAVLDNPAKPLFNRATQGLYPPGSVFKVPMMAAALMSGLYRPESHYTCTGVWDLLGPSAIKYDWTVTFGVPPHGTINLVQGLAFSCDAYFYTIAFDLYQYNADYMSQVARQFGLGEYTQVGQVAEAQGLIPDPEWKQAAYGEPWTPGDSVNMGIGQGFVLVTPLQIAEMMAAVRNRPRSVLGFKPSMRAAPRSPSMAHWVCSSTRRIWLRSTSLRVSGEGCAVAGLAAAWGAWVTSGSADSSTGDFARIAERSTKFSSSRTLPGQS